MDRRPEPLIERSAGDVRYFTYELFEPFLNLTNVVTTRAAGRSVAPFDSLNFGFHVGDDPDAVLENRAIVAQLLGFEPEWLTVASQIHGAAVAAVRPRDRGRGSVDAADAIPGTDAMITNETDVPLAILVADCVAISLYDPVGNAIGMVHAGWKGTLARIVEAAVRRMKDEYGSDPGNIVAGLSPAIGPCHYEIGEDVAGSYRSAFGEDASRMIMAGPDGTLRLDLWEANVHQLLRSGVPEFRIGASRRCTACAPELFYSYRRDGVRTGRFCGVIMLHSSRRRLYY
jgi:YfiH family protein